MKRLIFVRTHGQLFWKERRIPVPKHLTSQCRNHCGLVKTIGEVRNDLSKKQIFSAQKIETTRLLRRFSANLKCRHKLMDFDVWLYPPIFNRLRNYYDFGFKMKTIDDSFSVFDFLLSADTALQVVVKLLSELRFSELEGLLTPECKKEVEKNIIFWPKVHLAALALTSEYRGLCAPGGLEIYSDEDKRVFVEIRVIHYIYLRRFNSDGSERISFLDLDLIHAIFNTKFIREYTKGVNDQWTISAINVDYRPFGE